MASFTTSIPGVRPMPASFLPVKLAIALGLAALADWLFYDERIGISVVVFAIALICGSSLANLASLDGRRTLLAGVVVTAGLVPAIEGFNAGSLAIVILALGVGVSIMTRPGLSGLVDRMAALRDLLLIGPFRLVRDTVGAFNLPALANGFTLWLVPVVLGSVFVLLFVSANPLLEKWLSLMSPSTFSMSTERVLFWLAALSFVWPFVHIRWRRKAEVAARPADPVPRGNDTTSGIADFFGSATILRSLILFNLLFAVQTILDAIYLWGNGTLPADITYAAYAHQGAYPLLLTALLAASFVLAAMRPGGPAEQSKVIRPLVYLWVAQNVMLVASSILRLDLYVQIYLLTYWRVAAFIWMLLVALGLLLIVARIVLQRSNEWLIHMNLIALTATLYICSLINFAAIIADFNVRHSREASGKGVQVDMNYLFHLGPQALPAIDKALRIREFDPNLVSRRNWLVDNQQRNMASWRAWGLRNWRLQRYLDGQKNPTTG